MDQYELADLMISHVETLLSFLMAFVSLTSAVLITAFLGAGKLPMILLRLIAALYTLGSLFLIGITERLGTIARGIRSQMPETMTWHPAMTEPIWIMPFTNWFIVAAMVLTFACTLWYLFRARDYAFDEQ